MKRILSVVCFLMCTLLSYAQINKPSKIAPGYKVEQSKKLGRPFEKVALFEKSPGNTPLAHNGLQEEFVDFDLFDLASEQLDRLTKKTPEQIQLAIPGRNGRNHELELIRADIFAEDFIIRLSSTDAVIEVAPGIHYRGVVKGESESLASFSIQNGEVTGIFSSPQMGSWVINKVNGQLNSEQYVLYSEDDRADPVHFECEAGDKGPSYTREQLTEVTTQGFMEKCTNIYFEVDYDIYQDKGGASQAVNYVASIFNEVATLYANEDVKVQISEIFVWDSPSPYSGSSSSAMLNKFQSYRTSFNGDLAQLLSYKASGGIAVLDGLCHPFNSAKMSFSSIGRSFRSVPDYSFTVMVVAHELGHLFGSHHTHACVWNGNNTALDGCAGFVEGNCRNPGTPSNGGTIMSYCHLKSVGINFSLGFGQQPGNVIRNNVARASCLQVCSTGGGDGGNGGGGDGGGGDDPPSGDDGSCDDNQVVLTLVLDDFAMETSWRIKDANGEVLESGGPYKKGSKGAMIEETYCLKDGCYNFEIIDSYGDGMCCQYGRGSYSLEDNNGNVLIEGGQFGFSEVEEFCLNDNGGRANCLNINFNDYEIEPYGGVQDRGQYEIRDDGKTLVIGNNAWKAIALNYQVTPATVLEFDFGATRIAEIQGIGLDDNATISASKTFKLYGFQNWGIRDYDNYPGNESWVSYRIPVGQYYSGLFPWLFFVADHDSGDQNGNAFFRNVRIYEGNGCGNLDLEELTSENSLPNDQRLVVRPNPASEKIHLGFNTDLPGNAQVSIYNTVGQLMKTIDWEVVKGRNGEDLDVSVFPEGTYFIRLESDREKIVRRFSVVKP